MAVGIATSQINKMLDALCGVATYTATGAVWIKLHVGDPGAAGTSNAATETTRKQATFGSASTGNISNNGTLIWSNIAGSQDATHFTAWDDSSGGTFLFSGTATIDAYTAGDQVTVAVGDLDVPMTVAS